MGILRTRRKGIINIITGKVLAAALTIGLAWGGGLQMSLPVYALPGNNNAGAKGVSLVADGVAPAIGNPVNGNGGWANVWFGNYKQNTKIDNEFVPEPIKWRVLDNNSTDKRLFLLSDMNLDCKPYNETNTDVTWKTCTIRAWLNGGTTRNGDTDYNYTATDNNFKDTAFNDKEQKAVAESSISTEDINGGTVEINDRVFLLSKEEALNTGYGFTSDTVGTPTRQSNDTDYRTDITKSISSNAECSWWLRSRSGRYSSSFISNAGSTGSSASFHTVGIGVRPAFNIDLKSILFTSRVTGTANEYKLTVKDDKMNLSIGSGGVTRTGNKITVPYTITGDNKGDATNVSLLITDKEYTESSARLMHYETRKLSDLGAGLAGSVEFTLPDNFDAGWKAYIIAEDIYGEYETNYASEPVPAVLKPDITKQPTQGGKIIYGDPGNRELSITATSLEGGTLSYQWYKNTKNSTDGGTAIEGAVNASFTVPVTENTGTHYYYCVVTNTVVVSSDVAVSEVVTVTIDKASRTAPAAPAAETVTTDSITLKAVTGCEYSRDGQTWQESPVFSGLNADTEYTFYQRIKGDANHEVSPASPGAKIRTGKISAKSVSFAKSSVTIPKGKTKKLSVTVKPSNATNKAVTFKTSNKNIATVDKNGKVTAKKTGKVTITVTTKDGKKKAKCTVMVSSMTISKSDMVKEKASATWIVTPKLVNDTLKSVKPGNKDIATVSLAKNNKSFTINLMKKAGKTAITITSASGITKTIKISRKK